MTNRLARQYHYVSPRKYALINHSPPACGSPNIYALAQGSLKITAGLGACWCVRWWCVVCVWCVWCVCGVPKRPCHMRHGRHTRRRSESTHGGVSNLHTHTVLNRTQMPPNHLHESLPLAHKTPTTPMSSPQAHACHALNTYNTPTHNTQHTHSQTDRQRDGHKQTFTCTHRQTTGQLGWCVCDCSWRVYRRNYSCCSPRACLKFSPTLTFGALRKKITSCHQHSRTSQKNNETSWSTCGQQCSMKCEEHNRSKKRTLREKKKDPTSMTITREKDDICNRPHIIPQGILSPFTSLINSKNSAASNYEYHGFYSIKKSVSVSFSVRWHTVLPTLRPELPLAHTRSFLLLSLPPDLLFLSGGV